MCVSLHIPKEWPVRPRPHHAPWFPHKPRSQRAHQRFLSKLYVQPDLAGEPLASRTAAMTTSEMFYQHRSSDEHTQHPALGL